MEQMERETLNQLAQEDVQLKKLLNEHKKLEKKVEQFGRYAAYSSSAALRQKELKKEKLRGVDRMMRFLRDGEPN